MVPLVPDNDADRMKARYDFTSFHHRTIAEFRPAEVPDREPDFVSPAGSVYWDAGTGVFRSSDHWAGMNGCTGQAGCVWSLLDAVRPGFWAAGYCDYAAFAPVSSRPRVLPVRPGDEEIARLIRDAGGALPDRSPFPKTPPAWARLSLRGSAFADDRAAALFRADPAIRRVLTASRETLDLVLGGAGEIMA